MPLLQEPIKKRTDDLPWRLIHGAISTNRYKAHLNPAVRKECPFCGMDETETRSGILLDDHIVCKAGGRRGAARQEACDGEMGKSKGATAWDSSVSHKIQ